MRPSPTPELSPRPDRFPREEAERREPAGGDDVHATIGDERGRELEPRVEPIPRPRLVARVVLVASGRPGRRREASPAGRRRSTVAPTRCRSCCRWRIWHVSPPRAENVLVLPSKIAVDWDVGEVESRPFVRLKAMTGPFTGAK